MSVTLATDNAVSINGSTFGPFSSACNAKWNGRNITGTIWVQISKGN